MVHSLIVISCASHSSTNRLQLGLQITSCSVVTDGTAVQKRVGVSFLSLERDIYIFHCRCGLAFLKYGCESHMFTLPLRVCACVCLKTGFFCK